jgi:hypothetical protein
MRQDPGSGGTVEFLKQVYQRFNARDIEAVLAILHPDVTRFDIRGA